MSHSGNRSLFSALIPFLILALCGSSAGQHHVTGALPDGANYVMDVPVNWNGTLLLYSHGYTVPGSQLVANDARDGSTATFLLESGYALAGSSYSTTGWAVHEALPDQVATLDVFESMFGTP